MTRMFSFADGDRKYQCRVERATGGQAKAWWWFEVSGDKHRYAPFHASPDDTDASVQERIVAYYLNLVDRRSQPASSWHHRGRGRPAAAPAPAAGEGTS